MTFVGSINQELRSIISELCGSWKGLPIYVGCSGNFTVERVLSANGLTNVHSNDVSLYSCALGKHLVGEPFEVAVKDMEFEWLEPYLEDSVSTIAALMVLLQMLPFYGARNPYYERMWNAHMAKFDDIHMGTVGKLLENLDKMRVESFETGMWLILLTGPHENR